MLLSMNGVIANGGFSLRKIIELFMDRNIVVGLSKNILELCNEVFKGSGECIILIQDCLSPLEGST